jgi:hypothetical protein
MEVVDMNYAFVGLPFKDNIGNGKSLSAVELLIQEYLFNDKIIYTNIKIKGLPYHELTPENLFEVIEIENAVVLFDEISAIVHKNHRITEKCKQHGENIGLCYYISQFFRQVRKNDITTACTAQTFTDIAYQFRELMQRQIICEKFHLEKNKLIPCETDICPEWHGTHYIKQINARTGETIYKCLEKYYPYYSSKQIVKGWV